MSPEDHALLTEALRLSQENHKMLIKIERRSRWSTIWGFVKIGVVVVPLVLGYFLIQPFLEKVTGTTGTKDGVQELLGTYQDLLR